MYAAIIEWPDDAIEPPDLIVAGTVPDLFWPVIESLQGLVDEAYSDDKTFIEKNPYPTDKNDAEACAKWLWAMRCATTSPWVEFYEITGTPKAVKLALREM